MAVYVKGDGELRPDLRLDSQQLQHMGVGGGLVGALGGQATLHRVAVHPVGLVGIGVAHLHMGLIEGRVHRHPQETPLAPRLDEGIVPQVLGLLFGQILEPSVGEAAHLAEIALLEALVDGQGNGEQGCEQHRRQGDGCDGDEVAGAACLQALPGKMANTPSVGNFHGAHLLTVSRSGHLRCERFGRKVGRFPRCV